MTLARMLHRPFEVVAYVGDRRMVRVVHSQSEWDALDQMREQTGADPVSATPIHIDFGPTLAPEQCVMDAVAASNRMVAARLEADDVEPIRQVSEAPRALFVYFAVSAGLALVALVALVPMLIDGLEALWRMVGM